MRKPTFHETCKYFGWIFIAVICIVLFFLMYPLIHSGKYSSESPKSDITIDAANACREFVTRKLKAPWTAKFPLPSQVRVIKGEDNHYTVRSYVEAQDWSGNIHRQNYECVVRCEPEKGRWYLVNLGFGKE